MLIPRLSQIYLNVYIYKSRVGWQSLGDHHFHPECSPTVCLLECHQHWMCSHDLCHVVVITFGSFSSFSLSVDFNILLHFRHYYDKQVVIMGTGKFYTLIFLPCGSYVWSEMILNKNLVVHVPGGAHCQNTFTSEVLQNLEPNLAKQWDFIIGFCHRWLWNTKSRVTLRTYCVLSWIAIFFWIRYSILVTV